MLWYYCCNTGSDPRSRLWLPCQPGCHCRLDCRPEGEDNLAQLHTDEPDAQVGVCKGVLFMVCQCVGAVVGAAVLYAVVPTTVRGAASLGCTGISSSISVGQVR